MGWSCVSLLAHAAPLHRLPAKRSPAAPDCVPARPSCSADSAPPARTLPPLPAPGGRPLPSLAHSYSGIPHGVPCGFRRGARQLCRAAEYVFPDPIPEFAEAETDKFRSHMMEKLSKKDIFGSAVEEVVGICTGILTEFLHMEYGGPGTLLVIPFIDMADTINERGLPGGPQAARAAVVWAQKHVDKDWKEWMSSGNSS